MRLGTRKLLDRSFTATGLFSIALMAGALLLLLAPIAVRGVGAFVFRGTVEHRRLLLDKMQRGDAETLHAETAECRAARQVAYDCLRQYEAELLKGAPVQPPPTLTETERANLTSAERRTQREQRRQFDAYIEDLKTTRKAEFDALATTKQAVRGLLGPLPGDPASVLLHENYGQCRWDRAQVKAHNLLFVTTYDHSDPTQMGRVVETPRADSFEGTALAPLFPYVQQHLAEMLHPRWTFYWGFLFDDPIDSQTLGGIWPSILGTFYLTLGAMLIATPLGVIAAIYFIEYASGSRFVSFLRICVSTLAGVPSIVFGLFGLAFLINTVHVSHGKSVLAGSITLALLVLPTVIRAAEEAIRAVPHSYREAAMGLGAGKWRTVTTVVLPAALGGILTGTIISMGRAAGETAPIIFTAAVSVGATPSLLGLFSEPTQALPWSIYSLCSEHASADEIRHVQYGMVLTLVLLVLILNLVAIVLRARVSRKLRG